MGNDTLKIIQLFAQKALVIKQIENQYHILMIRYSEAKFSGSKLADKWGLPGGKLEPTEELNSSIREEVLTETGITIQPHFLTITTWLFEVLKPKKNILERIIATIRLASYVSGELKANPIVEGETTIETVAWLPLQQLRENHFKVVDDEWELLEKIFQAETLKLICELDHSLQTQP